VPSCLEIAAAGCAAPGVLRGLRPVSAEQDVVQLAPFGVR